MMHWLRWPLLLIALTAAAQAQDSPRLVSPQTCLDTGTACLAFCAQQQGIFFEASQREVCAASCTRQYAECRDTGQSRVDAGRAAEEANAAQPSAESREAKKALRNDFATRYGVEAWVSDQALVANPFLLKGKVIAVPARFSSASGEDEAVFKLATEFLVSGVKPEQFQRIGFVVLAVRVLGVKTVNFKDGEAILPHTEFVGVYECTRRCTEFFD
jgi:hypothetical protein